MTLTVRRRSVLLRVPSSPQLPVPLVVGPVLRTVLTSLSSDDLVDVKVALAVEPQPEHVVAFLALCAQVVPDLGKLVSCSLLGPADVSSTVVDEILVEGPVESPATLADVRRVAAQARFLRDIAHRPLQDRPLRLMVLAQHMDSWGALEPIVRAARLDPRTECTVVALEGYASRTPTEAYDTVAAEGWGPLPAAAVAGQLDYFDVIAVCDPYDHYRPSGFQLTDFLMAGTRVVLSPYAENIGAEIESQFNSLTHNLAWRIYTPNEVQKAVWAEHCASGDAHVRALGAVKGDWLVSAVTRSSEAGAELRRHLGTERVALWNPHFRMGPDGWSTFTDYVAALAQIVDNDPGLGVIARPHPMLMPQLESAGGDGAALAAWFRRHCQDHPRFLLDEDRDYRPAFAASTCLLSDLSSLIPEYLHLQRPVGYLRHPRVNGTSAEATWRDAVCTIDSVGELESFLRHPPAALQPSVVSERTAGVGARIVDDMVRGLASELPSPLRPARQLLRLA